MKIATTASKRRRYRLNKGGALIGGGGEEFDRYSVYVDNVDYWCTAQHLLTHFESCGTVNRISIPINEFGNPQGYAFVEFSDLGSADKALQLNGSTLRSRDITVSRKRKLPIRRNPNNKNNSGRGFGGPTQQQPSAISRNVGAYSNRSSRPRKV
jgi:RNA recognition motif-containing protein